jgi:hypothetical protein
MGKKKGFITIATGKEEYYRLAWNLLRSYRYYCPEPLPFSILCDRENEYTADFDDVILFQNGATNSYLDKLELAEYQPYDETVFIDADCLAYGDLNVLFEVFAGADEMSCYGRTLPLDDKTGWFEYENLGVWKQTVSYVVGLHGGIYYLRRGETAKAVFDTAKRLVPDYAQFRFKGKFSNPGDEPLIALAMAIHGCHPVPFGGGTICCYWEHVGDMEIDISTGTARLRSSPAKAFRLMHWGTRYTRALEYQRQIELLEILEQRLENPTVQIRQCNRKFARLMRAEQRQRFLNRVKNKLKRTLKR